MLLMNEIIERLETCKKDTKKKLDTLAAENIAIELKKLYCFNPLNSPEVQRYFLSGSFMSAANLTDEKDFKRATPLIKLPHRKLWIESVCLLATDGSEKDRDYRSGVLYTEQEDGSWTMDFLFANLKTLQFQTLYAKIAKNVIDSGFDLSNRHEIEITYIPADIAGGWSPRAELIDAVMGLSLKTLILLNTPRFLEVTESEDFIALNKKRARQGKPPLVTYRIVDLSKDMKRRVRESEEHEKLHGKAFHYVRGHFKYLNHANVPGLYWWSPHTAGSKEFGTVHKAYVHGKPPNEGESIH